LRRQPKLYADWLLKSTSAEDVAAILKLFGRVVPSLIEDGDWSLLIFMAKVLTNAGGALPDEPLRIVFENATDPLVAAYLDADAPGRQRINAIIDLLGPQGAEVLGRVLVESSKSEVLKDASDGLIKKEALARRWALQVLDDPDQQWHLLEKALDILSRVGHGDTDVQKAKTLCGHSHPRVRDEALHAVMSLKPEDTEPLIMAALNDEDEKVRWRATNALSGIADLSSASQMKLLVMLRTKLPEEKEAADKHAAKLVQVVRAIGSRTDLTYQWSGPSAPEPI
jgi:hypothetical protein